MLRFSYLWIFMALSACSAQTPEKQVETKLTWSSAPENSQVAFSESEYRRKAIRCWKNNENHSCIEMGIFSVNGSNITYINSGKLDEIPASGSEIELPNSYKCELFDIGVSESIWGENGKLDSNNFGSFGILPWKKTYVQNFIKENGLSGDWFDCSSLSQIFKDGSIAVLGTTKVKRAMAVK